MLGDGTRATRWRNNLADPFNKGTDLRSGGEVGRDKLGCGECHIRHCHLDRPLHLSWRLAKAIPTGRDSRRRLQCWSEAALAVLPGWRVGITSRQWRQEPLLWRWVSWRRRSWHPIRRCLLSESPATAPPFLLPLAAARAGKRA